MTIAVDFDGVIHAYSKGWQDGTIYDPPLPGALDGLRQLLAADAVFIHTSREPEQVMPWLEQHGFDVTIDERCGRCLGEGGGQELDADSRPIEPAWDCDACKGSGLLTFWNQLGQLLVTNRKLPATVYIDDRAHRFETWAKTMVTLGEPEEHWPGSKDGVCDAVSVGGDQCTRDTGHRLHSFEVDGGFEKARRAIRAARGEYGPQAPVRFGPCHDATEGGEQP